MKKAVLFVFSVILIVFCSCTSNNSEKPLICKSLGFDSLSDGKILVTASFSDTGTTTETGEKTIIKSYTANGPSEAVTLLLSKLSDAMYKPTESIFIDKGLEDHQKMSLVCEIMNSTELQLKCNVLECENAGEYVRAGKKAGKETKSFSEYFRITANRNNGDI